MNDRGWVKSSYSGVTGCVEVNMNWIHSSYSSAQGNCLEAAFKKSTFSGDNGCVEASMPAETVLVRDSKLGDNSPILEFSSNRWHGILDDVVADELNWIVFYPLQFNVKEREAFIKGAIAGEFNLPEAA